MKNKIFAVSLIILFALIKPAGLTGFAMAQENEKSYVLDLATLDKGYTIKNEVLTLGIKPNTFSAITTIYIVKKESMVDTDLQENILSPIFQISFSEKNKKPLPLKLGWQSFSNLPVNIYWRSNSEQDWQLLPGKTTAKETTAEIVSPGEIILKQEKPVSIKQISAYLSAKSAVVLDAGTGKILFNKQGNIRRPIASLTKLITAMVFLQRPASWQQLLNITTDDKDIPVTIGLNDNENVTVADMWQAMLIKSANDAAKAIARSTGLTKNDFVKQMNKIAKELDLKNSVFFDPSGLDKKNKASALDMAQLTRAAFTHSEIKQTTTIKETKIITNQGREIILKNSSALFGSNLNIEGAKSGYTIEAGRCQIIMASGPKRKVIVVVLASGPGQHTTDAYDLASWFVNN
jgi:hypothetical protein